MESGTEQSTGPISDDQKGCSFLLEEIKYAVGFLPPGRPGTAVPTEQQLSTGQKKRMEVFALLLTAEIF